jgi:NAD-dependent deacetylase sirtuin 4
MRYVKEAQQLLVVGSSLATFSAFRLVRQKKEEGGVVGLLNVGESRGDPVVDFRIGWEGGAGDILPVAAKRLWEARKGKMQGVKVEVERMLASGVVKEVSRGHATS